MKRTRQVVLKGGPERWYHIMDVKYEIYMILTGGLLKTHREVVLKGGLT